MTPSRHATPPRYRRHHPRVPVGPLADHVGSLLAAGMSCTQIAIAAGVSHDTVANIAREEHPTFQHAIAERVLAVRPRIVRDTDRLPPIGTQRRLQGLYAMGHGSTAISAISSIAPATIQNILYSRYDVVTAATYKAIRAAARELARHPGTSFRAKRSAAAGRWVPLAAWDNIDDPEAVPDLGEQAPRYAAINEDATWLIETQGYDRASAAERLGIRLDYLDRAMSYARTKAAASRPLSTA